jgi:hypothetical protein
MKRVGGYRIQESVRIIAVIKPSTPHKMPVIQTCRDMETGLVFVSKLIFWLSLR